MKILIRRSHKSMHSDMFVASVDAVPLAGDAIHYYDAGARYGQVLSVEHDARFDEDYEHPTTIVIVKELTQEEFYKIFYNFGTIDIRQEDAMSQQDATISDGHEG